MYIEIYKLFQRKFRNNLSQLDLIVISNGFWASSLYFFIIILYLIHNESKVINNINAIEAKEIIIIIQSGNSSFTFNCEVSMKVYISIVNQDNGYI